MLAGGAEGWEVCWLLLRLLNYLSHIAAVNWLGLESRAWLLGFVSFLTELSNMCFWSKGVACSFMNLCSQVTNKWYLLEITMYNKVLNGPMPRVTACCKGDCQELSWINCHICVWGSVLFLPVFVVDLVLWKQSKKIPLNEMKQKVLFDTGVTTSAMPVLPPACRLCSCPVLCACEPVFTDYHRQKTEKQTEGRVAGKASCSALQNSCHEWGDLLLFLTIYFCL